jgi:hypothetical protein
LKVWPEKVGMNPPEQADRTIVGSFLSSISRSRRLEDRIRRLSAQAVAATDPAEANRILEELTVALRHHLERLRGLATARPVPRERRQPFLQ